MSPFASLDALRAACLDLPSPDTHAMAAIEARDATLTKPPGSLGRLEALARWFGGWRPLTLEHVRILVFAGNHGVLSQNVTPWPADVTAQMVANFRHGGAAINQLAHVADAELGVYPMMDLEPTGDITRMPAMDEETFLHAVNAGFASVPAGTDLLVPGEMGIGNTTVAATLCAALFGGAGADWAGRGTGLDDAGVRHKAEVIDRALERHADVDDPLAIARCLGGHELAALLGAALAARYHRIPMLLDGFVVTAAVAPLARLNAHALDHVWLAHCSAEQGHRRLAAALGLSPLLDLGLRLGEGSGAALAIPLVRAALACHTGMASFAEARIDGVST